MTNSQSSVDSDRSGDADGLSLHARGSARAGCGSPPQSSNGRPGEVDRHRPRRRGGADLAVCVGRALADGARRSISACRTRARAQGRRGSDGRAQRRLRRRHRLARRLGRADRWPGARSSGSPGVGG